MSEKERTAPEHPDDVLAEKLATTADEITHGLQDLLPEQPAVELPAAAVTAEPPAIEEVGPAEPEPPEVNHLPGESMTLLPVPSTLAGSKADGRATPDSSSDDRLMAMLAWLTMVVLQLPIVSIIQLLSANTKDRLFQRHHAITALLFYAVAIVYEIMAGIVYALLGAVTLGCGYACLWVIFLLPHALGLYYALQAYNGKAVGLPVLSDFGRRQGWL